MALPAAVPVTALSLSLASIFAASPLGVSVQTISLGMIFAIVGMSGRFAFDIQKAVETGNGVKLAQALGWLGSGLLGAPFLTVIWIVFLRMVGAQTDLMTVLGLLFLGFTGQKGVTQLMGVVGDFIGQRFGRNPTPPKPQERTP